MKSWKHKNLIVAALVFVFLISVFAWGNRTQNWNMWSQTQNDSIPEISLPPAVDNSNSSSTAENESTTTLISYPAVKEPIPEEEATPAIPPEKSGCYVGGCSSQVCSSSKDIMTTCEWKEEYACYRTATCKKQADGECGWTYTPELNSCLMEKEGSQTL